MQGTTISVQSNVFPEANDMVRIPKNDVRKFVYSHHKGRAGRSRHPFYFTDAMTISELKKEVHAREAEAI